MINNGKDCNRDQYIEKYLVGKELNLIATLDAKVAVPTNVCSTNCNDVASLKNTCFAHSTQYGDVA